MDLQDLFSFIRALPLFAIYEDEELTNLLEGAQLRSVSAGELIFEQGAVGDTFYIVYSGKVRILKKNEQGKEVNLGICMKGDHFGETALITDNPRNATVRSVEDSLLIALNKHSFSTSLFTKPALRDYFDKFIRHTFLNHFLRTCTNLALVPPKDLQELLGKFHSQFFREGDVVFRQGAEADTFYLIESGKVKIVLWEDSTQKIINFLREGDFFGEKALVEDTTRTADVVCVTDCHLFSLSKNDFKQLILRSPKTKQVIEDRINSYLTTRPPIPYHEMIKEELSALKEIKVAKEAAPEGRVPPKEKKSYHKRLSSFYRQRVSFPFIKQYDQMSCGTTCIMMLSKYYGKHFSSSRVRELAHVDRSGASLANLASAAEQLGFATRGMRLSYDDLRSVKLPCIVHWQGYHYIVVYNTNREHVWVADPALGMRKYTKDYFIENWNGITLTLEPTPLFEQQKEDTAPIRNFLPFVSPYKTILFEILLASLMLNLFGLATPLFTQNIVDKVLVHHNTSLLNLMLFGMLIVLVFRMFTMIIRQYLIIHTSMKIDLRMLVFFYKHLLALPLGYFKVRRIGDFVARFGENMKIRNFLTTTAITMVLDATLIVVYFCLMLYYNVPLTFLVLFFIPLFIGITLVFTPLLKKFSIDAFAARSDHESHLIESINGIDTVKAMNTEYPTRWKWEDKFIKSLNIDFKLYNTGMYFHSLGEFIATLSSTLVLWYGAHQVLQGSLSVGALMAFMALVGSVTTPIIRMVTVWDEFQETLVSMDRLNEVLTAAPEYPESMELSQGIILREPQGEIAFEHVFFRYGGTDDPYILSNIHLKIPPGKTVAIVGRSGSGKTTLVKLLARFYEVTEGKIMIDGYDLKHINLSQLRRLTGFVLQESFMFNGSIRENISLGDPEATMEKIIEAAKLANAHEFISNLTLGYDTKIGESGIQLSGGQKQRIAIARVLYTNPAIIIFDEATSSLDTESEQAIQKNLEAILKSRTALIIAHRLSTVRNADSIVVLDNGEIVEQGTHEALMKQQGLYHYLTHQQLNL